MTSTVYDLKFGKDCEIASTATIHKSVILGNRVRVSNWAVIGENVIVEDDCFIGTNVILGEPTRAYYKNPRDYKPAHTVIGKMSIIRSHTCIYSGVEISSDFECGSFVNIRENTVIGSKCKIGSYCDIQGECKIGEGSRFHSSVHIAQFSNIGKYVWIFPYVLLLNAPIAPMPPDMECKGPTIGDYSVILARAIIMSGITSGKHVVVAANSKVTKDFSDWIMVSGDPAKEICDSRKFIFSNGNKTYHPYPWMLHKKIGFPWEHNIPPEWMHK